MIQYWKLQTESEIPINTWSCECVTSNGIISGECTPSRRGAIRAGITNQRVNALTGRDILR